MLEINPEILNNILEWGSLISGLLGLIFGGYAIHVVKGNSVVQKGNKTINNGSSDNSVTAGNDIIQYYGIDSETLSKINSANFSEAIKAAYIYIDKKNDENIDSIFKKTKDYIDSKKLDISGYTKTDWIEQYLANAKTTSDNFMQDIWAKVLAIELSSPDSFSFKTLTVLRNMSKSDFDLFLSIASYSLSNSLLSSLKNDGVSWANCIKLQELELLTIHSSLRQFPLKGNSTTVLFNSDRYCVVAESNCEEDEVLSYSCYIFTSFAVEILQLFDIEISLDVFKKYVDDLRASSKHNASITVHDVYFVDGNNITHSKEPIY